MEFVARSSPFEFTIWNEQLTSLTDGQADRPGFLLVDSLKVPDYGLVEINALTLYYTSSLPTYLLFS